MGRFMDGSQGRGRNIERECEAVLRRRHEVGVDETDNDFRGATQHAAAARRRGMVSSLPDPVTVYRT
ncbi:hypothetical protein O3P69_020706 [Scylla paramamosain]|uniref:Uncharacterized protein n=1 Tax=Scylla paramamosain TaxID=85552 RepID=A0AAW0TNX8_SCYPA